MPSPFSSRLRQEENAYNQRERFSELSEGLETLYASDTEICTLEFVLSSAMVTTN